LAWIEEPIVYDNLEGYARLTADLKTPVQMGENFYGPRALYTALQMKAFRVAHETMPLGRSLTTR
jgi:mandelate racemase